MHVPKWSGLAMALLVMTFLTACRAANQPPANNASPPQQPEQKVRVEQTADEQSLNRGEDENPQEIAGRLVRLATQVPGVHGATAVVAGKYAVVGIDVDQTLDRSKTGTVKYSVAQALKNDPKGATAIVTADPDIVQRLREMAEEIRQGRPVAGIANELAEIVGRIMPQVPRQVEGRERSPSRINEERINQERNTSGK